MSLEVIGAIVLLLLCCGSVWFCYCWGRYVARQRERNRALFGEKNGRPL